MTSTQGLIITVAMLWAFGASVMLYTTHDRVRRLEHLISEKTLTRDRVIHELNNSFEASVEFHGDKTIRAGEMFYPDRREAYERIKHKRDTLRTLFDLIKE